jgi:hypothetical protein
VELDSGLVLLPRFVELVPTDNAGVKTVTTIEVLKHGAIPSGVFEYQHALGATLPQSICNGFSDWITLDLPALLDALREEPIDCASIVREFSATDSTPALRRRVLLGPIGHLVAEAAQAGEEEHPFCQCCLFTRTAGALESLVASPGFHGVRLLALRQPDGECSADCRVNGEDWTRGVESLVAYAGSWPRRGVEMRKQYVVIHSL